MHSRCCCPPERPMPGSSRRSLTSSHRPRRAAAARRVASRSLAAHAGQLQAGGHVVVDRHRRERVGLLEHHADRAADGGDVELGAVDVHAVEHDLALGARAGDQLVHAVEAADERRLAAAGRPDDGGHPVCLELDVDILQGLSLAVVGTQPFDLSRCGLHAARGASAAPPSRRSRPLRRAPPPALGLMRCLMRERIMLLAPWPLAAQPPTAPLVERARDHAQDEHHEDQQQRGGPGGLRGRPGWATPTG